MFLSDLKETEKKYFLDLAYLAMESSGDIDPKEIKVFNSYKYECRLPDYSYSKSDLDSILNNLKESSSKSKKIILLELMGIWAADNRWDDGEVEMMYKVGHSFDIPDTMINRLRRWSKEIRELIAEGCQLIMR